MRLSSRMEMIKEASLIALAGGLAMFVAVVGAVNAGVWVATWWAR